MCSRARRSRARSVVSGITLRVGCVIVVGVATLAICAAPHADAADERRVIRLWPEGVPGAKSDGGEERVVDGRVTNVQDPTLVYVAPTAKSVGTAVIVCPGGGYARLAISNEGDGVAEILRPLGVATFENSLLFFEALRRAGVPAEMHVYERGAHGFGTRADLGPTSGWTDRWVEWMRSHGWLEPPGR